MRSECDGTGVAAEWDRVQAAVRGPGTGPPLLPYVSRTVVLVQGASRVAVSVPLTSPGLCP
ncbi:hypothetical protein GCM10022244_41300 [Streptomyces gulbargensis]|uniref:Uncharacterized protein n=1 Tax=Streptomyces gulbargensis TaxID=364901 RepID=A0ABP7MQ27_9ACTN